MPCTAMSLQRGAGMPIRQISTIRISLSARPSVTSLRAHRRRPNRTNTCASSAAATSADSSSGSRTMPAGPKKCAPPSMRSRRYRVLLLSAPFGGYRSPSSMPSRTRHCPRISTPNNCATALKGEADRLGNADLTALAGEVAEVAAWLTSNRENMSEAVALEVATALLLFENALAGFAHLSSEFAQQAQLLRSRLEDCILGKLRRSAPEIPLLDEMSRKAQERLLMNQVVSEMRANLRTIEQVLDAFFRDTAKRDELASLDKPVHQLLGALEMLGEQRARDSLAAA